MRTTPHSLALRLPLLLAAGCSPVGFLGVPGAPAPPDDTAPAPDTAPETGPDTGGGSDPWGTGADGDLDVSDKVDVSQEGSNGRDRPDAPSWRVTALDDATATLESDADGLAPGDEVMLVVLQGSPAGWDAVGAFDLLPVAAVDGAHVVLAEAPDEVVAGADPVTHVLVALRVPQYASVRVRKGGVLGTGPWTGTGGGVLAFRASGDVKVEPGGAIHLDSLGFAGGESGSESNCDAFQGESLAGPGRGGTCGGSYNASSGHWVANLGGGGALVTGGGGAHAEGATAGESWNGHVEAPEAGIAYGEPSLVRLYLGSGGGGVWNGSGDPGPGGAGGGILWLAAASLSLEGEAAIAARGGDGVHWAQGTWSYGAGAGAGGSVRIAAAEVMLGAGSVVATGGDGESTHERYGGDGGEGRIRVDCSTCNGVAHGTPEADDALDRACDPDPGHSEDPSARGRP